MKNRNSNLHKAKVAKNDEFYTQYKDIEAECKYYIEHFKDQWIYLPCDDESSNFWKYFVDHFNEYGLKRLTATHINLDGTPSYRLDYDGSETLKTALNGNGDFRSEECTKIKDECDMVITNPPFSLFKPFFNWLNGKKFLIIGTLNSITYKEVFPLIKENKIWLGVSKRSMNFIVSDSSTKKFCNTLWVTNLDHQKHHIPLELHKHYNEEEYPKYDNYDAINVDRVKDIPFDYDGVMGVPITFLDKYNPNQFEIIGVFNNYKECDYELGFICGSPMEYIRKNGKVNILKLPFINKMGKYKRILIKRKKQT